MLTTIIVAVTQANVNVGYGPRGIELLKPGLSAQQVLDKLLAEDTSPTRKAGRSASWMATATCDIHRSERTQVGRRSAGQEVVGAG